MLETDQGAARGTAEPTAPNHTYQPGSGANCPSSVCFSRRHAHNVAVALRWGDAVVIGDAGSVKTIGEMAV